MRLKYQYNTTVHVERARKRITQAELAQEIGVSRMTIIKIERNEGSTLETALKLAKFFETTVEKLFNPKEV